MCYNLSLSLNTQLGGFISSTEFYKVSYVKPFFPVAQKFGNGFSGCQVTVFLSSAAFILEKVSGTEARPLQSSCKTFAHPLEL